MPVRLAPKTWAFSSRQGERRGKAVLALAFCPRRAVTLHLEQAHQAGFVTVFSGLGQDFGEGFE